MIELKVYCDCGQKYKFDVEPANGKMPFTVACPICHRDGTAKANEMLQQMAVFKPIGSEPSAAPAPVAPPPIPVQVAAPPPISAPPPAPAAPSRLRISASAPAAESHASPTAAAPPTIAPAVRMTSPPASGRPRLGATAATGEEPGKKPSFALGLLGGFIGALIGAILYFGLYKAVGPAILFGRFFLALGVGAMAGWLANFLGKGEGSKELGGLAAVFTVVGILAAQYIISVDRWHKASGINGEITQAIEDGGYSANVKEAKEVVKAIPNGTDAEIRMYLAKAQAEEGQPPKPETISADEVKQFRDTEWTNYQDLASGKLTKEQYWAKNGFDPKEAKKAADTEDDTVKSLFILVTVSRMGIVSMIAGAGMAYKLCANA